MGTSATPPAEFADAATVLFGTTRRRILGWLLGHPDESFYLRQIVRNSGAALGAAQRELEQLTGAGLLLRSVQGRQVYFQANRAAPIFPELQGMFAKTEGLPIGMPLRSKRSLRPATGGRQQPGRQGRCSADRR